MCIFGKKTKEFNQLWGEEVQKKKIISQNRLFLQSIKDLYVQYFTLSDFGFKLKKKYDQFREFLCSMELPLKKCIIGEDHDILNYHYKEMD